MNNRDLIRQYVDTGVKIPKYQLTQLSGADKKTYLRKRLIAIKYNYNLEKYEADLMDDSQKNELTAAIENKITKKTWESVERWELELLSPEEVRNYVQGRALNGYTLTKSVFEMLSDKEKLDYLTIVIRRPKGRELYDYELDVLPDNLKTQYTIRKTKEAINYINNHGYISRFEQVKPHLFKYLPKELLNDYLSHLVNNTKFNEMTDEEFNFLPIELKDIEIDKILNREGYLSRLKLKYATDEQKMRYFKHKIENDEYLSKEDEEWYQRNLS